MTNDGLPTAMIERPIVAAVTMVAHENASRSRPDLHRRLKAPLGDALLRLLKSDAHAVRRLAALSRFKRLAFFGMDDETSHAELV
jgi:chorismate-pyruvate lyase